MNVTVDDERNPVPFMVSVCGVAPTANDEGESDVTVGSGLLGAVTAIDAAPNFVVSCVDVAVMVAVPAPAGVNIPELLTDPMPVGATDQVTAVLKLPVPVTVGVQVEVCVVRMDAGEQLTETDVIVTGTETVTVPDPDFVESSVDVAVIVAVPTAEGVNTPADVIVPSVADHETEEL